MSTKRSKSSAVKAAQRFASKNRRARRRLGLRIGDRVRIVDISSDLKDPSHDENLRPELRDMRTAELFRFCLGREFTIRDFGRYGFVELGAGASRAVREKFGKHHTIWMEPEHLKRVRKRKGGSTVQ